MAPSSPALPGAVENRPSGGEAQLKELLDRLSLTVFELDLEGRLVYVNRPGVQQFGYTAEDLARRPSVFDMVVPEERDRLRANVARRLANGEAEGFPYTALRKDGSRFPALVHATVVLRDGRPCGMQGYLVDVTERARMEDALRRRIALENLITDISTRLVAKFAPPDLDARIDEALAGIGRFMAVDRSYVFLFSPDGTFMDNTHEWVDAGISSERVHLQHIPAEAALPWFTRKLRQELVVPVPFVGDLPAEAAAERAEFEREGIKSLLCVAMVHGDNVGGFLGLDAVHERRSWSDDEIALLRVAGEILMGAVVRRRAELAVQESERKYRALVETTATGYVILDEQGQVLDANPDYVRMSGHRELAEIRGRSVIEWTAPADREHNAKAVRRCLQNGFIRNLQVDYVQPDGSLVPVLINATVTEMDGVRQIVTIIRDMTERIRLEAELLRSEKLRSIGVLAGGIAHDFNNILTAVLGNVSILQAIAGADPAVGEHLAEVERASERARELTRQLLTFSRGGEPVRKSFAPAPLIRESATLALRGRASACEFRMATVLSPVDGDEGQIGQVVRNLVLNASQAMNGGGTVVIGAENRRVNTGEVHPLEAGEYVVISVADRGPGITAENLPRIFDPYYTTKSDGRGLGLAVCHSIAQSHAGAITVDSQPGRGAVFSVYLPVATSGEAPAAPVAAAIVRGRGRVLIMDDEESVRQVASQMIQLLGYQAVLARDGQEAITAWQRAREEGRPFDLVIMDLTVPGGMGGREATRHLLALDPGARVVVSSGYSEDPVMANYREHGFSDVLAKPYRVADLSRLLSSRLPQG